MDLTQQSLLTTLLKNYSNPVVVDTETSTYLKGHPFSTKNTLEMGVVTQLDGTSKVYIPGTFTRFRYALEKSDIWITFNGKFDLHWIKRTLGITPKTVWDCQLAEFLFSNQQWKYPSLDESCAKRGLQRKLDIVKTEYWERNCSCHVSVVNKILNYMQKEFVSLATIEHINSLDLAEHLKSVYGEKTIQKSLRLLSSGDVKNLLLVWRQRLEHEDVNLKTPMECQTQNMIESWLKNNARYVAQTKGWQLTTTTSQVKSEIGCVDLVIQLWDILKSQIGWNVHKHTCKGTPVDTKDIPHEILKEYVIGDGESTLALFYSQVKDFEGDQATKYKLFRAQCNDLMVLQEMEYNGILYDVEGSLKQAAELGEQIAKIDAEIVRAGNISIPFNIDSPQQMSKLLYGGVLEEVFSAPIGTFKTGTRAGEVKYKKFVREHTLPRLVEPIKGTELAAEGVWSIDEDTLGKIKATGAGRKVITLYQERVKLQKLNSTYLTGIPKRINEMDWQDNIIHSNLNQCTVVSGRLSSTKPNVQNQPPEAKQYCISRY